MSVSGTVAGVFKHLIDLAGLKKSLTTLTYVMKIFFIYSG